MKRYNPIFQEMSVDDLRQKVTTLYDKYKFKYSKQSIIVAKIAKELSEPENEILAILQTMESNTNK